MKMRSLNKLCKYHKLISHRTILFTNKTEVWKSSNDWHQGDDNFWAGLQNRISSRGHAIETTALHPCKIMHTENWQQALLWSIIDLWGLMTQSAAVRAVCIWQCFVVCLKLDTTKERLERGHFYTGETTHNAPRKAENVCVCERKSDRASLCVCEWRLCKSNQWPV